ncbi:DEAD/DEAH box helicase [Allohahella marinimesophila]
MDELQGMTRYFRQSLLDAERLCPEDAQILQAWGVAARGNEPVVKAGLLAVDQIAWHTGWLDDDTASVVFDVFDKQSVGGKRPESVSIVMFPRVDLLQSRGGRRNSYKRAVLMPLLVFVELNRDGELTPGKTPPWIPRLWLSPNGGQNTPLGEFAALDEYLSSTSFQAVECWQDLVDYAEGMITAVTGIDFQEQLHEDYVGSKQAMLLLEPPVSGARDRMVKVLEKIEDGESPGALYRRFISRESQPVQALMDTAQHREAASAHLGQMTRAFPLSPKQRIALHHQIANGGEGELLAINGPPGTGKTTLLRSVVANLFVTSALREQEPPIIVAASNNNQAVTNILDSFARVNDTGFDDKLQGRWLPELKTYGLYCCSSALANERNTFAYHGPKGEGLMAAMQTAQYLDQAEPAFLEKVSAWHEQGVSTVGDARSLLLDALQLTEAEMRKGYDLVDRVQTLESELNELFGSKAALLASLDQIRKSIADLEANEDDLLDQLDTFHRAWRDRSYWNKLLSWVPFVARKNALDNARQLNEWLISLDSWSDLDVERYYRAAIADVKKNSILAVAQIERIQRFSQQYFEQKHQLDEWILRHQPDAFADQDHSEQHLESLRERLEDILDCSLRFTAFKLATHYWEARWLEETRSFVDSKDADRKSPAKTLRKWRRYAKLTPCFVSTFYMVPTFFTAFEKTDALWKDIPLFGEIDLLIVDEAGQALPEVAAASFALAKQALVVGDTDQIEPVWNVPVGIDHANLKRFELLRDETDHEEFWLKSGLMASGGNVMTVAQRQSRFHQFENLQRGLYLTEHRRCHDSIISYCNDLVYQGVMEPLRGDRAKAGPWPQLGLFPVSGRSRSAGGSRVNEQEAAAIAQWIAENKAQIVAHMRSSDAGAFAEASESDILLTQLGIITPFSKQADRIRQALKQHGLPPLTVGTVHAFQGAERTMVLFSSVYAQGDEDSGKFYDASPNMLNVAVSRARDVFLVFGDPDGFGVDQPGTPSGRLRSLLSTLEVMAPAVLEPA